VRPSMVTVQTHRSTLPISPRPMLKRSRNASLSRSNSRMHSTAIPWRPTFRTLAIPRRAPLCRRRSRPRPKRTRVKTPPYGKSDGATGRYRARGCNRRLPDNRLDSQTLRSPLVTCGCSSSRFCRCLGWRRLPRHVETTKLK
jgi:hypothetical protein